MSAQQQNVSSSEYLGQVEAAAEWLRTRGVEAPRVALVLGSGLGELAEQFEGAQAFDYETIPHFPRSTVEGHAGRLVYGRFGGHAALAMQGRFHFYEGWSLQQVTFPIRVFAALGCHTLIVTNSSGGININYSPGDLMIISDHINMTGANPLVGPNLDTLGPRFPDMTEPYERSLRKLAMRVADAQSLPIRVGVYAGVLGPSYETPAEIRMLRTLGGDAVGMSTVPEVIVANHAGMRVLGISCITNLASGLSEHKLTHDEVKETAAMARKRFGALITGIVEALDEA